MEEKIQKAIENYRDFASKNGYKLNPNEKIAEALAKSLVEREEKYGAQYCPCRKISGNLEEDKKIICPCIYMREEIQKEGHCHCGLFTRVEE